MLQKRLADLQQQIASVTAHNGIGQSVTVVAVTKNQPLSCFAELQNTNIVNIGENRAQALAERAPYTSATKHLIGHLQTNKAKLAVAHADLIQSVDSVHLAEAIESAAEKVGKVQEILLQVNIAREEAKFGVYIEDFPNLLAYCANAPHVKVRGLMVIMPKETCDDYYRKMYELYQEIKQNPPANISMDILSMGMSSDYLKALEWGANMIRVGSYLFS